jgi:uncharacterized damage-inducible protein DinB
MRTLETMIDYNFAEHRELWATIARLDEAVFLKDTGYSIGTIQRAVVHMIRADRLWLSRAMENSDVALLSVETVDRGEIREAWDDVEQDVRDLVGRLSDEDLQRSVSYVGSDGKVQHRRIFELLLHICNHGTVHRAEICAMLHMLGHTISFDVSLRRYLEGAVDN